MNYQPTSDIAIFTLCFIIFVLQKATYMKQNVRNVYVNLALFVLMNSCVLSIVYGHWLLPNIGKVSDNIVYIVHNSLYTSLISELVIYLFYTTSFIMYDNKLFHISVIVVAIIADVIELTSNFTHIGFYIENHQAYNVDSSNVFVYALVLFTITYAWLLITKNKIIINRIYVSLSIVFASSICISLVQKLKGVTSFSTLSFFMPILVVVLLFHSNSFNSNFGSLDKASFHARVDELLKKNSKFTFVLFYVSKINSLEKMPKALQYFKEFLAAFKYRDYVFRIKDDQFIMLFKNDVDFELINKMFDDYHKEFNLTHKIIVVPPNDCFTKSEDYISICQNIYNKMSCGLHIVDENDFAIFEKSRLIKNALIDIEEKHDLNDERVKVYCQPIFDVKNNKFTTAESLMRLELPGEGIIYPNVFIPIAEKEDKIHSLTLIILNKVCKFIEENPYIQRVSVNFSMCEIIKPDFLSDILSVMQQYKIDYSKIGFEITESMDANDFDTIRTVINALKSEGVVIYLDDFGTGYSNFEHIFKLPIDIIKFDRSLVISSGQDMNYKHMVSDMADMFVNLDYSILYEGVENDNDEKRCQEMNATYLQGYKYSKPIPIDKLTEFFE